MAFFGVTVEEIESVTNPADSDFISVAKMKNLAFQFVITRN